MRYIFFIFSILCSIPSRGQANTTDYQTGDLIFQDLDCGGLCDAIEAVTEGRNGHKFSHVGLVYQQNDSLYIIEAIGPGVKLTPIENFLGRTKINVPARLRPAYRHLLPEAIAFCLQQLGTKYDDEFLYDNGKYYCSELLYDAFKQANKGEPFFELEPMTFKQPGTGKFMPVWVDYYKQLNFEIPEGAPGCNPGGLSRSEKIELY